jgi:hypothetical protein
MGRTISSFRIALAITEESECRIARILGEWKSCIILLIKHNTALSISKWSSWDLSSIIVLFL